MFRRNVGGIDRVLRVTLGPILIVAGLFLLTGTSRIGMVVAVVGLLALLTGITRFCVLYIPFGISTARSERPRIKQVCDCELWMKEMQSRHNTADSGSPSEEDAAKATTAGR
jgi:DUF2892 family protein